MADIETKDEQPVRVMIWCVPRTASTVLAKCMSGIAGNVVWLEPYTYAIGTRNLFFGATQKELPLDYDGNEEIFAGAIKTLKGNMQIYPERLAYSSIKRDLENATSKYVFVKDTAYAINPYRSYLPSGYKHTFLIREPSRVFASFRKAASKQFHEMGLVPSEDAYDIIRDDPVKLQPHKLFMHQYELWKYVRENIDPNPLVIDANDLLAKPGPTLRAYCEAVGLPYSDALLKWEPSLEITKAWRTAGDGVFKEVLHFYGTAMRSTHFIAPQESEAIPRDQLTDDVIRCVDESMKYYTEMYENRLQT